ncbi:hypothetical protein [Allorhodopirellula heiligendammensis]|uniref:hypothetical protein n=1 Tax=Allorhodopirellula heiligendammensis TaxID=2714739 RepID=UPI00265F8EC0|nr:hypothetical protein [Allorhodopirellula heiligendammensis]
MNAKLRRKAKERKRKMRRRIVKFEGPWSSPMITPPAISYELADKQQDLRW